MNGERVAKLDPKEKATFYLSEGEWAVGANLEGKGLCSLNRERQERLFNIKAGEKKQQEFLRMLMAIWI
ncbi:putative lipoprotein [Klebsiella pneumoniae subsp. pneumoniae DSM 30104 = JCM 1662 = NBRC 14940]|nr:putative lipoprotein [Klebsiella pneumoniae subsp. pneumoniae DSM 30104 = JCM 1662 = NBRC 14940]